MLTRNKTLMKIVNTFLFCLKCLWNVSTTIGTKNEIIINAKSGSTKRNALILFIRSAFLRLTFNGIPSVVNIGPDDA